MSPPARLHPDDLATLADMVAVRVVAALREEPRGSTDRLIDAPEVRRRFGVSADWVRENADRLGVVRLGEGPRPRLRFDPEQVAAALTARESDGRSDEAVRPATAAVRRRPRTRKVAGAPGLLPFDTFNSPESETRSGASAAPTASPPTPREAP